MTLRSILLAGTAALTLGAPALAQTDTTETDVLIVPAEEAGTDVEVRQDEPLTTPMNDTGTAVATDGDGTLPVEGAVETETAADGTVVTTTTTETASVAPAEGLYGAFAGAAVADIVGLDVLAMDDGALEDIGEVESLVRVAAGGDEVMAIVGVGGFLGLGEHDVAVPLAQFEMSAEGLVLPGVTEDDLEAMAPFEDAEGVEELAMDRTVDGSALPEPASAPDAVIVTE